MYKNYNIFYIVCLEFIYNFFRNKDFLQRKHIFHNENLCIICMLSPSYKICSNRSKYSGKGAVTSMYAPVDGCTNPMVMA